MHRLQHLILTIAASAQAVKENLAAPQAARVQCEEMPDTTDFIVDHSTHPLDEFIVLLKST